MRLLRTEPSDQYMVIAQLGFSTADMLLGCATKETDKTETWSLAFTWNLILLTSILLAYSGLNSI